MSQEEADKDAESATTQPQGRMPGIRFPNRRTPDGKRVSMLSIEEQQRYPSELLSFPAMLVPAWSSSMADVLLCFVICHLCLADMTWRGAVVLQFKQKPKHGEGG